MKLDLCRKLRHWDSNAPKVIEQLEQLDDSVKELDLRFNNFGDDFFYLSDFIRKIPPFIQHLNFAWNGLGLIPDYIFPCIFLNLKEKNILSFNLTGNRLSKQEDIFNLEIFFQCLPKALMALNLSCNQLHEFPNIDEVIALLPPLITLDLSYNNFAALDTATLIKITRAIPRTVHMLGLKNAGLRNKSVEELLEIFAQLPQPMVLLDLRNNALDEQKINELMKKMPAHIENVIFTEAQWKKFIADESLEKFVSVSSEESVCHPSICQWFFREPVKKEKTPNQLLIKANFNTDIITKLLSMHNQKPSGFFNHCLSATEVENLIVQAEHKIVDDQVLIQLKDGKELEKYPHLKNIIFENDNNSFFITKEGYRSIMQDDQTYVVYDSEEKVVDNNLRLSI